jgi:hypothetical protein
MFAAAEGEPNGLGASPELWHGGQLPGLGVRRGRSGESERAESIQDDPATRRVDRPLDAWHRDGHFSKSARSGAPAVTSLPTIPTRVILGRSRR